MSARIVMWGFVASVLVLHGVVAWLAPRGQGDWDYLVWAAHHRHDGTVEWIEAFLAKHYTLGEATNYLLARYPIAHALVTPLVMLAVVWGTFTLAMRRLPKLDAWADVTLVVLIAALLWIAAPRCGLTYFHRPAAAFWLYGTAVTLWFLAPLRCGWRVRGWQIALVVIAGFLAGTSTRQLGILATLATGYAIWKTPKGERQIWLWIALAAVAIGTAVGFHKTMFDYRGLRPGFERSLVALNLPIYEIGELVSLVGGLALTKIVIGTLWPRHAGERFPESREMLPLFGVWLAYIVVALLGPRYAEASLYPAAVIMILALLPALQWAMTSKPLRIGLIVIAVGTNVIAWSMALSRYVPLAAQYQERLVTLRQAERGSVVAVKTYAQIRPEFWAYGEDWADAARRQYIAVALFKLKDIELSPAFRRLEYGANLELRLETDGVTPEQLRAAGVPAQWASTLKNARVQFDDLVARLRGPGPISLRLVVDKLPFDVLRGRPLLAASFEGGRAISPRVQRRGQDDESRQPIVVMPRSIPRHLTEAYAVIGGRTEPITFERGRYLIPTLTTELHTIVACDPARCFLVDAFIPAL